MNVLIDTQSIIWFAENNPMLSPTARQTIEDDGNTCFVSMASFWEMSIKKNLGKLDIKGLPLSDFMDEISENGFLTLDIRREHVIENERLPLIHRDPFDRLIIAQAIVDKIVIVSNDSAFDDYSIVRVW
ncbi:MAG: type II toxin-antitoxin system VapC family toxin [Saprospiraceae bacterium]|jgi:PIN domain nuclease of toxin-antitoxin system|nr:type II toxin-antitoxin system VapC family toxin [Saprospiraceae bacterium]